VLKNSLLFLPIPAAEFSSEGKFYKQL